MIIFIALYVVPILILVLSLLGAMLEHPDEVAGCLFLILLPMVNLGVTLWLVVTVLGVYGTSGDRQGIWKSSIFGYLNERFIFEIDQTEE